MIKDNLFGILGVSVIVVLLFGMAALFAFLSGGGVMAFWAYSIAFSVCAALGWISGTR